MKNPARFVGMPSPDGPLMLMKEMNYRTRQVEVHTVGSFEFECSECGGDVWGTLNVAGRHGKLAALGVPCSSCSCTYTVELGAV
jgi:hypothetical protein